MSRLNKRIDSQLITKTKSGKTKKTKRASSPPRDKEEASLILDELWEINPLLSLTCSISSLTGLRYSDASWLRFDDFYDENGSFKKHFDLIQQKPFRMRISRGVEKSQAVRKSIIRVYTNNDIKEIVDECKRLSDSDEFLFANSRSRTVDETGNVVYRPMSVESANEHLSKVAKKLKLGYTLGTHSFRKHFVKLLVAEGTTMEKIRDFLGQSSLQSTNHYLHTFDDELAPIINKISLS